MVSSAHLPGGPLNILTTAIYLISLSRVILLYGGGTSRIVGKDRGLVHSLSQGGILYTIEGNKGGVLAPVRVFDYVMGRIEKLLGFGRVPDAAEGRKKNNFCLP